MFTHEHMVKNLLKTLPVVFSITAKCQLNKRQKHFVIERVYRKQQTLLQLLCTCYSYFQRLRD